MSSTLIDIEYLDGVWFNEHTGEFQTHRVRDGTIQIVTPDESIVLDEVEELDTTQLVKVDEQAVTNPVEYYKNTVNHWWDTANEFDSTDYNQQISFLYAESQIEITEA